MVMGAHDGRAASQDTEPSGLRAGECAEGDRCARYFCRGCGQFWLGNDEHICGASAAAYFRGSASSREQLEERISRWMDEELEGNPDVTVSARNVLDRVKSAALG